MVYIQCSLADFFNDESGQGIVEYGAVLAFTATIVAMVFSAGQGSLREGIRVAFSSAAFQLAELAGG
jgi:Flp pilus assembly pilin Flp